MGWTVESICLKCDSCLETDLDGGDSQDFIKWVIEHWGHHVKLKHFSEEDVELAKNNDK